MKNLLAIIVFLGISVASISAQDKNEAYSAIECIYEYKYLRDTASKMSIEGELISGDSLSIVTNQMILLCGGTTSLFYSYKTHIADSTIKAHLKQKISDHSGVKYGTRLKVYKQFAEGNLIMTDVIPIDDYFRINEEMPTFNWTITDESKEMFGYHLIKATCFFRGRNYEAWFAPSIPISDGPWKFTGLPGLIFEVYDTPCCYYYKLVGIKSNRSIIEYDDVNYTDGSLKQYYRLKRKILEDAAGYLSAKYSGSTFTVIDKTGKEIDPKDAIKKMKYDFQEIF